MLDEKDERFLIERKRLIDRYDLTLLMRNHFKRKLNQLSPDNPQYKKTEARLQWYIEKASQLMKKIENFTFENFEEEQ